MPAAQRPVAQQADQDDEAAVRAVAPEVRHAALDLQLIHHHRLPTAQEKSTFLKDEVADGGPLLPVQLFQLRG